MTLEERLFKTGPNGVECDREAFGLELRKYRLRHGWTQRQLGAQWGLSRYTILRAENGQNITWESAYRLASKLAREMAKDEAAAL